MNDDKFKIPIGIIGSLAGEFVNLIEKKTLLTVDSFIRADLIKSLMSPLKKLEIQGKHLNHPVLDKTKKAKMDWYKKTVEEEAARPKRKKWK